MTDETTLPVLLIVEDDEGLQRQLKWAYDDYRIVIAGDRRSAVEALRLHEPAVVTLDLGLPPDPDGTEEGFATLSEMLALKPDTKIIVASGHGARESALKAVALGAYDFYRKPIDIDELGLIVARAFHVHGIEEENRRLEQSSGSTVLGSIITAAPEMLKVEPDTKIIVASGHGARESALKAVALGAYDFYRKPIDIDELGLIVARAFHVHGIEEENRRLEQSSGSTVLGSIITAAPEMLKVARTIERVASTNVSVMLLGASGTGKELLARAVHEQSDRPSGPFVAINCAAIPENLLEAELFGYERGAFTGAVKSNVGKIELAQGGTLFLDEVGDIPLPLQVKLLRFLQERVIERIGGREPIAVDTRIVCATHQDLEAMIADGRFREDLYYRLAEIVVKIPSLSERPGDAVLLARHFVNRFAREMNTKAQDLSPDATAAIDSYGWPGNVRELENRVKRAVIMADGKLISAPDLDLPGSASGGEELMINLRAAREIADRKAIRQALSRTDNNISGAAKLLGISRPTLYDLLKQYQLTA